MPNGRETSRWRRVRRVVVRIHVVLSLYVMIYLPLSYFGEYRPVASGRLEDVSAVPVMNWFTWRPLGHSNDVVRFVFAPLHLLDRAWWHHDMFYMYG